MVQRGISIDFSVACGAAQRTDIDGQNEARSATPHVNFYKISSNDAIVREFVKEFCCVAVDSFSLRANAGSLMKHFLTTLAAIALAPAVLVAAEFPDISHEELVKAIEAKTVTIIDVNGSTSYKQGHIPGALNFVEVKSSLAGKLPADKNALVVAYCGSETCSAYARAAKAAKDLGYTNVKHYSKGLAGWKASGAALEAAK
jgi:rhodanese-related sulfurtransferase